MGVPENIDLVHRFNAAGPADDDTARGEFAVPEIVWHVPGDNPVSGTYAGHEAVFAEIGRRMAPVDEWAIEVREVMGNADVVVSIVDVVARRGELRVASAGGHVLRCAPDGRIAEVWGFVAEQAALDGLLRS